MEDPILSLDANGGDPVALAASLAREFAATAIERDRRGGTPKRERDALRASGLLALLVPRPSRRSGRD